MTTDKELPKEGPTGKGPSDDLDLPNGSASMGLSDNPKKNSLGYVDVIGRIAAVLSIVMYVAYITQISNNLSGHPGSPWQPLAAFFNCMMWTLYGFLKPKKDLPIICANVPGIVLGFTAFITALIH